MAEINWHPQYINDDTYINDINWSNLTSRRCVSFYLICEAIRSSHAHLLRILWLLVDTHCISIYRRTVFSLLKLKVTFIWGLNRFIFDFFWWWRNDTVRFYDAWSSLTLIECKLTVKWMQKSCICIVFIHSRINSCTMYLHVQVRRFYGLLSWNRFIFSQEKNYSPLQITNMN